MKTVYYGPSNSMKFPIIEFSTYTYGMDFLLEKYLHFFSSEELSTPTIESQLKKITEELKLKTRELSTPFTLMPTETGLPVLSSYSIPVVYSVKGSLKMSKIM